jgi:hypothetical protein
VVGYGNVHFAVIIDVSEIHSATAERLAGQAVGERFPIPFAIAHENPWSIGQARDRAEICEPVTVDVAKRELALPDARLG